MHSQINKDSQITLPKPLLKELSLKPGDLLELEVEQEKIVCYKTHNTRESSNPKPYRKLDEWDVYGILLGIAASVAFFILFINVLI